MTRRTLTDWLELPIPERQELAKEAARGAAASIESHNTYTSVLQPDELELPEAGELASIPYGIKDNIDVRGLVTTGGTPAFEGSYPEVDASLVHALRDTGAVAIGKLNMHELAFGLTSNNGRFGPTLNPFDTTRTAGGSSGGSAATVALGTVPFALGTDTGASVTVPSSFCGVVGFRPSTGRYPGDGVIHLTWTRDAIGLHTHTVHDARILDRIITRSPLPSEVPALGELTLGVPKSFMEDLDPEVEQATAGALEALTAAGVKLVEVEVADAMTLAAAGFGMVFFESPRNFMQYCSGLSGEYADLTVADIGAKLGSPDVAAMFELMQSSPISAEAYEKDASQRNLLRSNYQQLFESTGIDALIYPTAPNLPMKLGSDTHVEHNGKTWDMFPLVTKHVAPGGLAGAPQLTVPISRPEGVLPIAITLEGGIGTDPRVLAVGEAVQAVI